MEEEARQGLGKPAKGAATPTQLAPGGRGPRMARAARLLKRTLCVRARVGGHLCPTLCDPVNCIARQAPLSTGFSRQEYWSGLPFPPVGGLPNPGVEPTAPALQVDSLPPSHQGSLKSSKQDFYGKYPIFKRCQLDFRVFFCFLFFFFNVKIWGVETEVRS